MAAPFVGNQDFRGYLNYLGTQGDSTAKNYLNFVGGDYTGGAGGVNQAALASAIGGGFRPSQTIIDYYNKYQGLNAPQSAPQTLPSIYGGGGGGYAPAPVYAPKLDVASLNAKARSAAEGAVNPYYTKLLNDFLGEQSFKRQTEQKQYETNVTNLQDSLKQTLEQNAITKTRTTEDVAQNVTDINVGADEFQQDTGQEFDVARQEQARELAAGGLTGGIGAQKRAGAQEQRNTQESRQEKKFQAARDQQALFKGRTFEDLLKSDVNKTTETEKGKKQAKFDLDNYIKGLEFSEKQTRNTLEEQRLQRIAAEQQNQAKLLFNNYLAGISNPAQYEAAVRTYGSVV